MQKLLSVKRSLMISLIILLLNGCGAPEITMANEVTIPDSNAVIPTETPNADNAAVTNTPTPELPINPLTGLAVQDPSQLERKPVFVKVSNHPATGRPHAGLSFADMVFEYYIGSGQNRFMAVFYGQDAIQIGPVRSGRRVDAEIVPMYSGILGYGSADADTDEVIVNALGKYAISHLEGPCPAFCGEDTHDATGVFANSAAISEWVDMQGWENGTPDLPGMFFQEEPPDWMLPAQNLLILFNYYNRGEWRYDAETGKYLRWIEAIENYGTEDESMQMIPLTDRITGKQLAFSNIILMFAKYDELAPTAHAVEIWKNDDGRRAYLFRDGGMVKGQWAAPNDTDPIKFTTKDGDPMPLKPGNTWIAIMGINSTFEEINPGEWKSFFFLP